MHKTDLSLLKYSSAMHTTDVSLLDGDYVVAVN